MTLLPGLPLSAWHEPGASSSCRKTRSSLLHVFLHTEGEREGSKGQDRTELRTEAESSVVTKAEPGSAGQIGQERANQGRTAKF